MGYLTGLFCIICVVAIINGSTPFVVPSFKQFLESPMNSLHSQESLLLDHNNQAYFDDESDENTKINPNANGMILPVPLTDKTSILNEWRHISSLRDDKDTLDTVKRNYEQKLVKDAYQHLPYTASCDVCQTEFKLFDLGQTHFPRFLVRAVCHGNSRHCRRGTKCKEIPYKVRVLTHRNSTDAAGDGDGELPNMLNTLYKLTTISVSVSCQCAD